ncbi:DUF4132 domain-containing protein [Yinghuangia aomiensis]
MCRNSAGKRLKSVPAKLADDPAVSGLRQFVEWLDWHERRLRRGRRTLDGAVLAVPAHVVVRVWPDPAWQAVLRDLVVTTGDGTTGFLRDADPERGIGMVDLDGDTVRVAATEVRIPHPVLLEDLDDLREFAAELGVDQKIGQLYREVWHKPENPAADARDVDSVRGRQVRPAPLPARPRHVAGLPGARRRRRACPC